MPSDERITNEYKNPVKSPSLLQRFGRQPGKQAPGPQPGPTGCLTKQGVSVSRPRPPGSLLGTTHAPPTPSFSIRDEDRTSALLIGAGVTVDQGPLPEVALDRSADSVMARLEGALDDIDPESPPFPRLNNVPDMDRLHKGKKKWKHLNELANSSLELEALCRDLDHFTAKSSYEQNLLVIRGESTIEKVSKSLMKSYDLDEQVQVRKEQVQRILENMRQRLHVLKSTLDMNAQPVFVDADYVYKEAGIMKYPIVHLVVLLLLVLSLLGGVSQRYIRFTGKVIHTVVGISLKTGMPRVKNAPDSWAEVDSGEYSVYQRSILDSLPTTLDGALKCLDIRGKYIMYATCPECHFTNRAQTDDVNPVYPDKCANIIVGKDGRYRCNADLLKPGKPGIPRQPIKPYAVASLKDYLARTMADPEYVEYCDAAMDRAFASRAKPNSDGATGSAFDANFIINHLKGPDGGHFVDRGSKTRLAFELHTDFFNPNGSTNRGPHHSVGIISAANLALPPSIRYLPEYMFVAAIIPGPREPLQADGDHYLRPVIEQFVEAWKPGLIISRTAKTPCGDHDEKGTLVECALVISLNDLPAARKFCGFAGSGSKFLCTVCKLYGRKNVWNTSFDSWERRNPRDLREKAKAWLDAGTSKERAELFKKNGVRWSSFWLLPYWNPTLMLVVDGMHAILEGLVQYECRDVLRLDASELKKKKSPDGTAYAFHHTWDSSSIPLKKESDVEQIPKIQSILELALEGEKSTTLVGLWKQLEHCTVAALRVVALSLGLGRHNDEGAESDDDDGDGYSSSGEDSVDDMVDGMVGLKVSEADSARPLTVSLKPAIQEVYLTVRRENHDKGKTKTVPVNVQELTISSTKPTKAPFIAFLLNWRLTKPKSFDGYLLDIPTGSPDTLKHIHEVLNTMLTPSWIDSVPKNFGDPAAGTLKANEWKLLATLFLPVALVTLWAEDDTSHAVLFRQALKHTMALFQAVILACKWTMTKQRADTYRSLLKEWVDDLRNLFPHVHDHSPRTNMHISFHLYEFFDLFGPMISWWTFPFERVIGVLERTNTNNRIGGEMELTLMRSQQEAANLRRWLRRPDHPPVIDDIKEVFDTIFIPITPGHELPWEGESEPTDAPERAHYTYGGFNYSRSQTHEGNSIVFIEVDREERPVPARIEKITQKRLPEDRAGAPPHIFFHVRRYEPLPPDAKDPFTSFPHLAARTFSSSLNEVTQEIPVLAVVSHAAKYDFTKNRSVFINLKYLLHF